MAFKAFRRTPFFLIDPDMISRPVRHAKRVPSARWRFCRWKIRGCGRGPGHRSFAGIDGDPVGLFRQLHPHMVGLVGKVEGEDTEADFDAWKVGGKMFACIGAVMPGVSVKTDSIETAQMLIDVGVGVKAPYFLGSTYPGAHPRRSFATD